MRHKIYLVIFCTFLFYVSTFESGVQGPPTDKKKETEDETSNNYKDKEYVSSSKAYDDDMEEVSALKIVPAPDLSKERNRRKEGEPSGEEPAESADILMIKQAKWLQKMVQEIGGIQYTIVSDNQEIESSVDDNEVPPLLEPLPEKELTSEQLEGKIFFTLFHELKLFYYI